MPKCYIKKVRYTDDHQLIDQAVCSGTLTSVFESKRTRDDLINDIVKQGKEVHTAFMQSGKWEDGEPVQLVDAEGNRYLRIDSETSTSDFLGEVEEYTN